jgi:APA family basic amino acid/polyamine antiporter
MTGARVTYQQARDGLLFEPLGRVHAKWGTPHVALIVQLVLSCVATWFLGSFEKLAGSFVFTMWIFYGLAGATIFILRFRRPDAERPFRCWGYPVVPGVFVLSAAAMTVLSILDDPAGTLPWIGLLLAGAPVYFVWERLRTRGAPA